MKVNGIQVSLIGVGVIAQLALVNWVEELLVQSLISANNIYL